MKHLLTVLVSLCFFINPLMGATHKPTLRDKIGQMLLMGFEGKKINAKSPIVKAIEKDNIGGVILFDYNSHTKTFDKNIESPSQVKELNHDLQQVASKANLKYHRPQLPLLISVDYEGGKVNRLGEQYGFPPILSAKEVGQKGEDAAEATAKLMADTLKEAGFNLNFAPIMDVEVNSNNPIIGKKDRSFSEDANRVAPYARIYSRQFLNQNIQCVYKHFPGHGSATQDSHLGFVDVTHTWQPIELKPYEQLLKENTGCSMVMTAHIVNRQLDASGLPATLSHKILTGLLRKQLHFKGVIITDDMQMKAISARYGLTRALVMAINAGADMLIFGNNLTVAPVNPKKLIDLIEANVVSGTIKPERINEAYQRILALKQGISS